MVESEASGTRRAAIQWRMAGERCRTWKVGRRKGGRTAMEGGVTSRKFGRAVLKKGWAVCGFRDSVELEAPAFPALLGVMTGSG